MVQDDFINNPEDIKKLRIVKSNAQEGRGRPIAQILYDRSIRGPYGIGGKRFSSNTCRSSRRRSLSQASPSSVIRNGEEDENQNEEMKRIVEDDLGLDDDDDDSVDSLSQILRGEDSLLAQRTNGYLSHELDSLSEVLNGAHSQGASNLESSCTGKPASKRLKLNAYPTSYTREISNYAETSSVVRFHWEYLKLAPSAPSLHANDPTIPPRQQHNSDCHSSNEELSPVVPNSSTFALSTISVAFSEDGKTLASTHGDHSVKISCCNTGRLIRNLEGHPRTPWTVKYHPTNPFIVASGCLGYQVRVWDWNYGGEDGNNKGNDVDEDEDEGFEQYGNRKGVCLNMIRLTSSIISLSFHPQGQILAIASGRSLHLWAYEDRRNEINRSQNRSGSGDAQRNNSNPNGANSTVMTQIRYENSLRCVHFPPSGDTIILGMVNPSSRNGTGQGENIYSLRLWDFDIKAALNPNLYLRGPEGTEHRRGAGAGHREVLSNFRTLLPRAILYNDGGLDVSADGKQLCGCAEYWLPFDKNSIMEHIEEEEEKIEVHKFSSLRSDSNDNSGGASGNKNKHQGQLRSSQLGKKKKTQREHKLPNEQGISDNDAKSPNPSTSNQVPQMLNCRTPPTTGRPQIPTTPPSPPGRRFSGMMQNRLPINLRGSGNSTGRNTSHGPPPPPLPPSHPNNPTHSDRQGVGSNSSSQAKGRFVPHVVTVNLDENDELGKVLEATPLGSRATSITCVKFSPSAEYCLLGYGVREHASSPHDQQYHPVTSIYRVRGGMVNVATLLSDEDDVNIARFHPDNGHGFVYGTKQGRVRILSPRPWNYYSY